MQKAEKNNKITQLQFNKIAFFNFTNKSNLI